LTTFLSEVTDYTLAVFKYCILGFNSINFNSENFSSFIEANYILLFFFISFFFIIFYYRKELENFIFGKPLTDDELKHTPGYKSNTTNQYLIIETLVTLFYICSWIYLMWISLSEGYIDITLRDLSTEKIIFFLNNALFVFAFFLVLAVLAYMVSNIIVYVFYLLSASITLAVVYKIHLDGNDLAAGGVLIVAFIILLLLLSEIDSFSDFSSKISYNLIKNIFSITTFTLVVSAMFGINFITFVSILQGSDSYKTFPFIFSIFMINWSIFFFRYSISAFVSSVTYLSENKVRGSVFWKSVASVIEISRQICTAAMLPSFVLTLSTMVSMMFSNLYQKSWKIYFLPLILLSILNFILVLICYILAYINVYLVTYLAIYGGRYNFKTVEKAKSIKLSKGADLFVNPWFNTIILSLGMFLFYISSGISNYYISFKDMPLSIQNVFGIASNENVTFGFNVGVIIFTSIIFFALLETVNAVIVSLNWCNTDKKILEELSDLKQKLRNEISKEGTQEPLQKKLV